MNNLPGGEDRPEPDDSPRGWIEAFARKYRPIKHLATAINQAAVAGLDTARRARTPARELRLMIERDPGFAQIAAEILLEAVRWEAEVTDDGAIQVDTDAALRFFLYTLEEHDAQDNDATMPRRAVTDDNAFAEAVYRNVFKPRGIPSTEAVRHIAKYLAGPAAPKARRREIEKRLRARFDYIGLT